MLFRESDWLIVLRDRESLSHGEAASSDGSNQGKHGLHSMGGHGPLFKEGVYQSWQQDLSG
jgi:hypothetical protein